MHTSFQSPQKNCKTLSHVFRMFYLPDWGWHLGLLSVVAGILFCYTILPARLERLSQLAFDGVALATLVAEGGQVGCIICGIIVFSLLKRTLLHYVMRVRVLNRAQPLLLKQVLALPLDYFTTRSPGDLLSVMTSVVRSAVDGVMALVEPAFIVLQSLYLIFLMCFLSLELTLAVLGLLAFYIVVLQFVRRRQARLFEKLIKSGRHLSSMASDSHQGFLEIKHNALESVFEKRFTAASRVHWGNFSGWFKTLLISGDISEYIGVFLPALALFVSAMYLPAERVDNAAFVSLYTLAIMLVGLLTSMNQLGFSSASGFQAWKELVDVIEQKPESEQGIVPSGYTVQWQNVGKKLRGKSVLDGVSLYIAEGEKVMICGRSGEGKSTILKMLPGLLTPDTGTACVGGVSVTEAQPKALREQTAFIPQEPYLFSTTLRENLCYGREIDEKRLDEVVRQTQLDAFVANLPDGLDTHLGPDGVKISGGEKSRIALARALLAQPRILILDEATASLDSKTEERIYEHLLAMDCTVIGVTHRLSTLKIFPRVVALADGKIVLDGLTDEVVASPVFQELFAFQMEKENV